MHPPGSDGLRIYAELVDLNHFKNNIIVNPGSGVYIKKLSDGVLLEASNNLFVETMSQARFVDPEEHDYHLQGDSPAINMGADLSAFGVHIDYDRQPRPWGGNHDIGAYEFVAADIQKVYLPFVVK